MGFQNPSVADFKDRFDRDFPFGADINTSVRDKDIGNAYVNTNININPALFTDQASYSMGYLLLAAHYLVTNLRSSSQGLNGQYNFLQTSKGAGAVNEAFQIPQMILDNPYYAMLTKSNYGAEYLQLIYPQLSGAMFIAYGSTRP